MRKIVYFYNDFINEKLVGKKAYLILSDKYDNNTFKKLNPTPISVSEWFKNKSNILVDVFNEKYYKKFFNNKNISTNSSSYEGRYIYQIDLPLNIFIFDEYHLNKLHDPTKNEFLIYYNTSDYNVVIDKIKQESNLTSIIRIICLNEPNIRNVYSGFYSNENTYTIFLDLIDNNLNLINGKYKYDISTVHDFEIPEFVLDELIRYTTNSNRNLNKNVVDWLINNYPKPTKNIQLFRGISFNDRKELTRYLKIKDWGELKLNQTVKLSRGKESSWSYNYNVAKSFVTGWGSDKHNVIIRSLFLPNDILADLTLLPDKYRHLFKYQHQNEVIVKSGLYEGKIKYYKAG